MIRAGRPKAADAEQPTLEQNRHPVRHALDLAEDVGGDEDRALSRQRADVPAHLDDLARIEAVGGLVEDQQGRIPQQSLGDGDALAVAAREPRDEVAPNVTEGQPLDCALHRLRRRPDREPLQLCHEDEEFADAHPSIEGGVLRHVADATARRERVVDDVQPGDAGSSGGRPQVAGEDAKDRGLARTVRAEEPHDLTGLDLERDAIDGQSGSVPLAELLGDDDGGHAGRAPRAAGPAGPAVGCYLRRLTARPTRRPAERATSGPCWRGRRGHGRS